MRSGYNDRLEYGPENITQPTDLQFSIEELLTVETANTYSEAHEWFE